MTLRPNSGKPGQTCTKCANYRDRSEPDERRRGYCTIHDLLVWASSRPLAKNCYQVTK